MPDSGNNAFVLAFVEGKGVYVVQETNDKWGLPGGGTKRGESQLDGALRELQEETGLRVPPYKLTAIHEHTHGNGKKTTIFTCKLSTELNFEKIFTKRRPGETKNFSFAVRCEDEETPLVVHKNFRGPSSWRGSVRHQYEYFPVIPKVELWKRQLYLHNPKLKKILSTNYVEFVLQRCEDSGTETGKPTCRYEDTLAYISSKQVADKWKENGIFRETQIEKYREMCDEMRALVKIFFFKSKGDPKFDGDIYGYRSDTNHLDPNNRDAWPVALCEHGFGTDPPIYKIDKKVDVFPVFLFDREGQAYNECEVVALAAHNRKVGRMAYQLTKIDMDKALSGGGGAAAAFTDLCEDC